MSYCVNCGVKLKKSEKKCPLCNTRVINPNDKKVEYERVYSSEVETLKKINYKYAMTLLILMLVIVSVIIFGCDFLLNKNFSWSIYVVLAIFYLSCHSQYVLQKNIYIAHIVELIGAEVFMYVIAVLNGGIMWYLYLGLPFILIIWLYIILCTFFLKKKIWNLFRRLSICILVCSLMLVCVEILVDLYVNDAIKLSWSIYASLPLVVIGLIMFIISFNRRLIEEIKQRIFI